MIEIFVLKTGAREKGARALCLVGGIKMRTTAASTLPFLSLIHNRQYNHRLLSRITCSSSPASPSSPPLRFNITFAPPKPQSPSPSSSPDADCDFVSDSGQQLFIPWIVRGDDGKFQLKSKPPARLIHAFALEETGTKRIKKESKEKDQRKGSGGGGEEAKYSKAARRFYNENFRDGPQRLGKVLAAAGGVIC